MYVNASLYTDYVYYFQYVGNLLLAQSEKMRYWSHFVFRLMSVRLYIFFIFKDNLPNKLKFYKSALKSWFFRPQ